MTHSFVVHCRKAPYDVYVGRPSKWGNSFVIGKDGTREEVIVKYEVWLKEQPELLKALPELKGKVLGCWCRPDGGFRGRVLCHGQILAGLANGVRPDMVD